MLQMLQMLEVCTHLDDIRFSVPEDETHQKISTLKELRSENSD